MLRHPSLVHIVWARLIMAMFYLTHAHLRRRDYRPLHIILLFLEGIIWIFTANIRRTCIILHCCSKYLHSQILRYASTRQLGGTPCAYGPWGNTFFLEFTHDGSLRDIKASCSRHKLRVTAAFLVMIFPILQVTRHIIADYSRAFLGMRCREISERVNVRTLLRLVVHLYGILTGAEHIFILYYRFAL